MFGSILGLWVIQPVGPGASGSVRDGLTLLERLVIGWSLPLSLGHPCGDGGESTERDCWKGWGVFQDQVR